MVISTNGQKLLINMLKVAGIETVSKLFMIEDLMGFGIWKNDRWLREELKELDNRGFVSKKRISQIPITWQERREFVMTKLEEHDKGWERLWETVDRERENYEKEEDAFSVIAGRDEFRDLFFIPEKNETFREHLIMEAKRLVNESRKNRKALRALRVRKNRVVIRLTHKGVQLGRLLWD